MKPEMGQNVKRFSGAFTGHKYLHPYTFINLKGWHDTKYIYAALTISNDLQFTNMCEHCEMLMGLKYRLTEEEEKKKEGRKVGW